MNIADMMKPNTPWNKVVEAYGDEETAISEMSKYSNVDIKSRVALGVTPADVWEYEAREKAVPTLTEAYLPTASKIASREGAFGSKSLPILGATALDVATFLPRNIGAVANMAGFGKETQTARQALAGGKEGAGGAVGVANIVSKDPFVAFSGGLSSLGKTAIPKVAGKLANTPLGKAVIPLAQKILPKAKEIKESSTAIKGASHFTEVANAGEATRRQMTGTRTALKGGKILGEGAVYEGQKSLEEGHDITPMSLAKTTAENVLAETATKAGVTGLSQLTKHVSTMGKKAWEGVLKDKRAADIIVSYGLGDQALSQVSKSGDELFGVGKNIESAVETVGNEYKQNVAKLWGDKTVKGEEILDDLLAKIGGDTKVAGTKVPLTKKPEAYIETARSIFDNAAEPYKLDLSYPDPKTGEIIPVKVLRDIDVDALIDIRQRIKGMANKVEGANITDSDIFAARQLYDKLGEIIHKGDPKTVGLSSNLNDLIYASEVVDNITGKAQSLMGASTKTAISNVGRRTMGTGTGAGAQDADRALTRRLLDMLNTAPVANALTKTSAVLNPLGVTEAASDLLGANIPTATRILRPVTKEGMRQVEEKFGGDRKNSKLISK